MTEFRADDSAAAPLQSEALPSRPLHFSAFSPLARRGIYMASVLAIAWLIDFRWGERLFINEGLGWDGVLYAEVARDFEPQVLARRVDSYRLQRMLPSGVVHYGLRALSVDRNTATVIAGFQVLNGVMLIVAALFWNGIAAKLRLRSRAAWLGFAALFINFAVLKHQFYYPVLTDVAALAVGCAVAYFFLAGAPNALMISSILGAFVWPTVAASGAALLLFPRGQAGRGPDESRHYATVLAAGVSASLIAILLYLYYVHGRRSAGMGPIVPIYEGAFYVSILVFAAYVFVPTRILAEGIGPRYVLRAGKAVRVGNAVRAIMVIALPLVIVKTFADPMAPPVLSLRTYLGMLVILPVTRPGISFVSHAVYYGPAIVLVALSWRRISAFAHRLGPGAVLFLAIALLVSLTPESRQLIFAYPLIIGLMVAKFERHLRDRGLFLGLVASSLVLAKFWLPINRVLPRGQSAASDIPLYHMNIGPYMHNAAFVAHALCVVLVGIAVWWSIRSGADSEIDLIAPGARVDGNGARRPAGTQPDPSPDRPSV